jgi:RNA recognition motif-containing protein
MDLKNAPAEHLLACSPSAESAEQANVLFVGGLPLQVTESQLYNYFRKFGDVSRCEIPSFNETKKKKFALVEFISPFDALAVLKVPQHTFIGTLVKIEKAMSASELFEKQLQASNCKLFVSGDLIARTNSLVIFQQISTLGQVERVKKVKCASKTFNSCFVTMKSIADAEYLLEQKSLVLPILKKVTFKRFVPRSRKGMDSSINKEPVQSGPCFDSKKSNPQLVGEGSIQTQNISDQECFGIRRTIVIRPGLCIVSNIRHDKNEKHQANRLYLLGHNLLQGDSSKQNKSIGIRNLDRNLRFNISGIPSTSITNYHNIKPKRCLISQTSYW